METFLIILVLAFLSFLVVRLANKLEKLNQDLTVFKTDVYNPEGAIRSPAIGLGNALDVFATNTNRDIKYLKDEYSSLNSLYVGLKESFEVLKATIPDFGSFKQDVLDRFDSVDKRIREFADTISEIKTFIQTTPTYATRGDLNSATEHIYTRMKALLNESPVEELQKQIDELKILVETLGTGVSELKKSPSPAPSPQTKILHNKKRK